MLYRFFGFHIYVFWHYLGFANQLGHLLICKVIYNIRRVVLACPYLCLLS